MLLVLLFSFVWAAIAPLVDRWAGRAAGWVLALGPAGLFAWFVVHAGSVSPVPLRETISWVPTLGVEASVQLDGRSLIFALLVTGLGALIAVYAGAYLEGNPGRGRFFGVLLAFLGAMLGLVLADNLILLFVFWELTSLCSYWLVGFKHEKESARSAALQALLVTTGGGLAMLAGFILLGVAGGSFELSHLVGQADAVRAHPLYLSAFLLIALGAFTKSAQVPFHF